MCFAWVRPPKRKPWRLANRPLAWRDGRVGQWLEDPTRFPKEWRGTGASCSGQLTRLGPIGNAPDPHWYRITPHSNISQGRLFALRYSPGSITAHPESLRATTARGTVFYNRRRRPTSAKHARGQPPSGQSLSAGRGDGRDYLTRGRLDRNDRQSAN
ncbi:hypothetical protein CALVIDRAFT_333395 [Calocera viscosa TUFC12733]|uniref:Uncharacterized protein n=1 Tax=Calocera viscosa (strain TUFC12733) TaxID=1330018 RepID=A0A167HQT6_CALVF|nr:hypothetical protein CALVIDRAFT_333395 [Calocera viscosa TUFC12733]